MHPTLWDCITGWNGRSVITADLPFKTKVILDVSLVSSLRLWALVKQAPSKEAAQDSDRIQLQPCLLLMSLAKAW